MAKFNVYAIEMNGCDGIDNVDYVAANDRDEAIKTAVDKYPNMEWIYRHNTDVMWLEGAVYEADKPCFINSRLCKDNGTII